jgi:nicotinamidase-related amidase
MRTWSHKLQTNTARNSENNNTAAIENTKKNTKKLHYCLHYFTIVYIISMSLHYHDLTLQNNNDYMCNTFALVAVLSMGYFVAYILSNIALDSLVADKDHNASTQKSEYNNACVFSSECECHPLDKNDDIGNAKTNGHKKRTTFPLPDPKLPELKEAIPKELKQKDNRKNVLNDTRDVIDPCAASDHSVAQDSLETLHPSLSLPAETTALVIIDVQKEYWSDSPSVQKDFPNFPINIARTIDICRSRGVKIIWVRADYRYSHSLWLPQFKRLRGDRNLGEVPCEPSSPDSQWEIFARPRGGEIIIPKQNFSSTSNSPLLDILRVARVETVLVCGLITSVCVHHSAYGLFEAGFRIVLLQDACADRGIERHKAVIKLYGDYIYEVLLDSKDLMSDETGILPSKPLWITTTTTAKNAFANMQNVTCCAASSNTRSTACSTFTAVQARNDDASVHSSLSFAMNEEWEEEIDGRMLVNIKMPE